MAGDEVGKVGCFYNYGTGPQTNQNGFTCLYNFFMQMVAAGYATRIALQWGLAGTGTDYWDEAAPFGENAFAVFRMDGATSGNVDSRRDGIDLPDFDYYVLIQWADISVWGASPGNPGLVDAATGDGTGLSVALRADGASPWNGSTNNDGTDSKGATVWDGTASTLFAFPISNAYTGGSHVANAQNNIKLWDQLATEHILHMIGNADSFVIYWDGSADGVGGYLHFVGIYDPRPGLNPDFPIACVSEYGSLPWTDGTATIWGDTAGSSANQGGVIGETNSDLMSPLSVGLTIGMLKKTYQPNTQMTPPQPDTFPIRIAQRSALGVGYIGNLDPSLIRVGYGAPSNSVQGNWAFFNTSAPMDHFLAVPWNRDAGSSAFCKFGREGYMY